MEYDKRIPRIQLVKTIEPARELISHLSRLSGFIFDSDKLYRDDRVRRTLNDAIFYALYDYLLRGKKYPTNFEPELEFRCCCAFIMEINGFDDVRDLLDDDALEELLEVIQDHFVYIEAGDRYDIWEVKADNRTLLKVFYKGDYRIELFEFMNVKIDELEERLMVVIDDSHTLFKEYDRRNRAVLEERNGKRSKPSLSF